MASSSTSTNVGNMVVVTHVLPAAATGGQQQPLLSERGRRFNRGKPEALGTVQILIGLMLLLFTIVILAIQPSLGAFSGIFVWGSLIYIASGSVTVAAGKYSSRCLIIGSLVMNIIAAVVAVVGIILYSLDGVVWFNPYYYDHDTDYRYGYYPGFSVLLAVFQFLQFIISIVVAGYGCNATCGCCGQQPRVVVQTVEAAQAPPQFHTASAPPQPHPQQPPAAVHPADAVFAAQAASALAQPHPQAGPYYKSPLLGAAEPPAYELSP